MMRLRRLALLALAAFGAAASAVSAQPVQGPQGPGVPSQGPARPPERPSTSTAGPVSPPPRSTPVQSANTGTAQVVQAPQTSSPQPPPSTTDASDATEPSADSASAVPARAEGPSMLEIAALAIGALGLILAAAVGAGMVQLMQRLVRLQRAVDDLEAAPAPAPVAAGPGVFRLADALTDTPEADRRGLAELLAARGGEVETPAALVSLARANAELFAHAEETDERLRLMGSGIERAMRTGGGGSADSISRLVDERLAAALALRRPPSEPMAPPLDPPPLRRAPDPPPEAAPDDTLWPCADRLFRRVGLANVTEEVFNEALQAKKAEILADGSYAQRPDLLRGDETAQNMAGVLRLAATEWANRSDDVTIPVGYRTAFDEFIADYAGPDGEFELIWANSGESAKDSAHETSRIEGVRHEVVAGVRWPGLRGRGEVYMRAKVAIA